MALPIINLSLVPVFPAKVTGDGPVTIIKSGLEYVIGWNIETFSVNPNPGANTVVLSHDPDADETGLISISDIATPVIDGRLADQATAEAGVDNVKLMTPLRNKQQVDARLANQATSEAGSDNFGLVTPLRLAQAAAAYVLPTRAVASAVNIPAVILGLRTTGYTDPGDGGGARYRRAASEPAHTGKFQSADGAWWELSEDAVTPMMFGAFGGLRSVAYTSLPNDAVALQGMLDYLSYSGGRITAPSHLHFRTDAKLQMRVTRRQLPAAVADSTIHFTDTTRFMFEPLGDLMLQAGAAIDAIIELIFYTPLSNLAPFYTTVANLRLRGNGLATYCFQSNYCMHVTLKNCDMEGSTSHCANWIGYGVARIVSNVFKGPRGIRLVEGGGDSLVEHNDFYPTANSSECITLGTFGGNTEIRKNVFSGVGATGIIGVRLINSGPNATVGDIRHVTIEDNEFSGCAYGVYATKSTGKRIYGLAIEKNHVTPSGGGAIHTGVIAHLDGVDDSTVKGNFGNTRNQLPASSGPFVLLNCNNVEVSGNKLVNYVGAALYLNNCTFCQFNQNLIQDCARGGAGSPIVDLDGASTDNDFLGNIFNQTSASYGQLGIYERTGATRNYGNDNRWQGVATPSTLAGGSTSVFKLR